MASEVDICNTALAQLGDEATVASLNPPEGSAQAEHCARFYPIARDTLLQSYPWNFASKRATLAQLGDAPVGWTYSYARPIDALDILAVQRPETPDNFEQQEYVCEVNSDGQPVIYCNVEDASVRYLARVSDTSRFPPLFVTALSWHLAAMLAGPIIKGDAGAAEARRCAQMAEAYLGRARASDANQRHVEMRPRPDWIGGRGPASNTWRR